MIHTITKKIQRMIAPVVLAAILAVPLKARANSVEVFVGDKNTATDVRMSGELAPKTNISLRTITSADYNNQVGYFGLADVSYNLYSGLDAVIEIQASPEEGILPRPGLQYFRQVGNLSLFALGTVSSKNENNAEFVAEVEYLPPLTSRLNLSSRLENVTNVGEQGYNFDHNFSVQRGRLGVSAGKYSVGAAADVTEARGDISYVVGGFLKVNL